MSSISAQFYHMPGRYERGCVGWHCAKVKGHAELKNGKNAQNALSVLPLEQCKTICPSVHVGVLPQMSFSN